MDFKLFGSILLIVGTSIGAGMLALPIATAQLGFYGSLILLVACWSLMTLGAFLLLEANLWMPLKSNVISMAKGTIGTFGQMLSWLTFLLLLYSLLCAYIAGGSDLFHNLFAKRNINFPLGYSALMFTFLFGAIVSFGIRSVDYVNRVLMVLKFASYFILIFLLVPLISSSYLSDGKIIHLSSLSAIMVTITSFGFASIIPSLRIYFNGDVSKLKRAIFIGSLVPLICYIAWDAAIMGVIPLLGDTGLVAVSESSATTSSLVNSLQIYAPGGSMKLAIELFTSICVLTSFLGASLCLTDFLADGLKIEKSGWGNIFICALAFIPPLLIVIYFPNVFIKALEYAGIYCVILLIFLPAWMVWRGRYHQKYVSEFTVPGGKPLLALLMILSLALVIGLILSSFSY